MEYFGSLDQQAMSRRAEALFRLIGDDPRVSWYGRNVVLADFEAGGIDMLTDLVRLQGATAAYGVPRSEREAVMSALEQRGLKTDWFGYSVSKDGRSPELAEALLGEIALPSDLSMMRIGPETSDAELAELAEVALEAGVLPPPASVLRGKARRGVVFVAREDGGKVVACASAVEAYHPESTRADHCWWGMLATRPERRGEKIALVLGAEAMLAAARELGFRRFYTGVRDDNAPSTSLCRKLGVEPSEQTIVIGMDPAAFSDARITK